jgi:hypothetical protein
LETLREEGSPPLRASCIAAAIARWGFHFERQGLLRSHARQQDANRVGNGKAMEVSAFAARALVLCRCEREPFLSLPYFL